MNKGIDALNDAEREDVRRNLRGLVNTLKQKKAVGSVHGVLTDESIVLNALEHPERGDVEIIILQEGSELDLFISNRREEDSPFSLMGTKQLREHPGRRPIDNASLTLKDGEFGLFLLSIQDREQLRHKEASLLRIFSSHFGISETPSNVEKNQSDLRQKPLEQCSFEEKYQILVSHWPGDNRIQLIQSEFYEIGLTFARYKQKSQTEYFILNQITYKETIGQLIRDCYPYGIRVSLRRDYPKEHNALLDQVHATIRSMAEEVRSRARPEFPTQVRSHLIRVSEYLQDILDNDPELSRVV